MSNMQRLICRVHSFLFSWMVIAWCASLIVLVLGNNIVLEARTFYGYGASSGRSNRQARDTETNHEAWRRSPVAFPSVLSSNILEGGTTQNGNYVPPDTSKCPKVNYDCHPSCRKRNSAGCNICDCGTLQGSSHSPSYQSSSSKDSASSRYCFAMVICMLSCKDGYTLGERDSEEGCQTCHCMKTNSAASHSQNSGNVNEHGGDVQDAGSGGNYGAIDGENSGIMSGSMTGGGGDRGYFEGAGEGNGFGGGSSSASGFDQGTGGSNFGGGGNTDAGFNGSPNAAGFGGIQGGGFGGSSNGGGMNPMFPGAGMGPGSDSSSGASCSGPFCLGQGGGMGGGAGGGGSGGGGGGGCTGPFCLTGGMSGGGGGGAGAGGGMPGTTIVHLPQHRGFLKEKFERFPDNVEVFDCISGQASAGFSPFMMAASGGAGSGMGGGGAGSGGCTGPFCTMAGAGGGMGGAGPLNMGGMQASSAGDGNCSGPECSAKDGGGAGKDQSLKNK